MKRFRFYGLVLLILLVFIRVSSTGDDDVVDDGSNDEGGSDLSEDNGAGEASDQSDNKDEGKDNVEDDSEDINSGGDESEDIDSVEDESEDIESVENDSEDIDSAGDEVPVDGEQEGDESEFSEENAIKNNTKTSSKSITNAREGSADAAEGPDSDSKPSGSRSSCSTSSNHESPIALEQPSAASNSSSATKKSTTKLDMNPYYKKWRDRFYVRNTGEAFHFQFRKDEQSSDMEFNCGDCGEAYVLASGNCHWGSDDYAGSEHTIDENRFPLEIQLLHYKKSLKNFATARKTNDGVLVVSILYEIGTQNNAGLDPLIKGSRNARSPGSLKQVHGPFKVSLLFPSSLNHFAYSGSFTTSPCEASTVKWIVFENPESVSSKQLEQFRKLYYSNGETMVDNFRSIQTINGRTVNYNSVEGNQFNPISLGIRTDVPSFIWIVITFLVI